jgi:glycosyltransferase involved in cell wall biosynthesis/putative flippase GtrA
MSTMTDLERRTPPAPVDQPVVDVVVPVFNEAHVLAESIGRLHRYLSTSFPFTWRITIVDNASTDGTWDVATGLARDIDGVRARHLDRKGRGLALRTAWGASEAAVVAYTDVDLSTGLDALLPLVAPLVSGHSDLAIGSRLAPGAAVARGPKREAISRSYNLLLRTVFASRVRDAQCGFKAVRADVVKRLLPEIGDDGWFFDTELLLLAEHNGLRIHEVPVDWVDDPDSRVRITRTAMDDLRGVVRMAWRFATGHGRVELAGSSRPVLADDMGRGFVAFAVVGGLSTLVSLLIFLGLREPIGPIAANWVALTATFVANTWANWHWTVGRRDGARRQWLGALVIYVAAGVLGGIALAFVDAVGGGLAAELLALLVTWSAATVARFLLVRSWAVAR